MEPELPKSEQMSRSNIGDGKAANGCREVILLGNVLIGLIC